MNQNKNLTGSKRKFSIIINDNKEKQEPNLQPPFKKQKIEVKKENNIIINNNIILYDDYYASTFTCFEKSSAACINEEGNIVFIEELGKNNRINVLKIDEYARKITFYEDDQIFVSTNEGKLIEIRYKENQRFVNDAVYVFNKENVIIQDISCDSYSGFRLLIDGTLKSFGCNYSGLLGIGSNVKEKEVTCGNIDIKDKIVMIESNSKMVICKTENDEFYAWGNIYRGILPVSSIHCRGIEHELSKPVICSNIPKNVVSMKISFYNIIFLTGDGLVYKCGFEYLNKGGKPIFSRVPKLIENIPLIKKISSCDINFILLDDNDNIWTFSKYNISKLIYAKQSRGLNSDIKLPFIPSMIKRNDITNVIDISQGGIYTFVKTQNGDIFNFSYDSPFSIINRNGVVISKSEINYTLQKLKVPPNIWRTNRHKSRQKSARKIV